MAVLRSLVSEKPRILHDPEPSYAVRALADSAVNLQLRTWTLANRYWEVCWALMQRLKPALEEAGLTIPLPQRELHTVDKSQ